MSPRLVLLVALVTGCTAPQVATPSASPSQALAVATPTPTPSRTAAPSASPSPIPLPSVVQLSAPSAAVVWALVAEARLFRSTDRGETWTERSLPPRPNGLTISFVNERDGWGLVRFPPGTQCQAEEVTVWQTTDGAATWHQLPGNGIGAAQCKGRLLFADRGRGYFAASDPNHAPVVYRSVDGGSSWAVSPPIADPPGFTTNTAGVSIRPLGLYAFGDSVLLLASDSQLGRRYVFRSDDGGRSWAYTLTVPGVEDGITMITSARWIRLGASGGSFETTDAGATWHAFTTDHQAAPIAPSIVFGDAQTGYATVPGTIQRTLDGGAHWSAIRTPGTF